jgi:lipid-binding SYLF domain-containing protein
MTSKKKGAASLILALSLAVPWNAFGIAPGIAAPAADIQRVENAIRVVDEMMKEADKSIPASLLEKCAGIAIIPDVIEAAYVIGGRHGKGVMLLRDKSGAWSPPAFLSLTGGSVGWQIGVESVDIILVFMTARSAENIANGKFTLGADAGVAAGPVGRKAQAGTDIELKAEIYSYSRSRGLYVGLSVQGAALSVDAKADQEFYGAKDTSPQAIFEGKAGNGPDVATKLRQTLERFAKPAK